MTDSDREEPPPAASLLGFATLAAVLLVGPIALGFAADRWLGTLPLLTFTGLVLGIVLVVLATYTEIRSFLSR